MVGIFYSCFYFLGILTLIHSISLLFRSIYGNFGKKKDFKKLFGSNWVLITGCSSGSGKYLAENLAKSGMNIIGTGHNDQIYEVQKICTNIGVEFIPIIADFRKNKSIDEVIEISKKKDIGAFYLNAGYPMFNDFWNFSENQLIDYMNAMVTNQSILIHAFIKQSVPRKNKTLIYLTSSMAGQAPWALGQLYAAAKSYISSFGKYLSQETSDYSNIFVQTIHPSYFRNSCFSDQLPKHSIDLFKKFNNFYQISEQVGEILYKTALNSNHIDTSLTSIVIRFLFWLITPPVSVWFLRYLVYTTPLD